MTAGVLQSANKWLAQLKPAYFIVTGHSLGGGLATLFAAEHQNSAEGRPIWNGSAGVSAHVITFGAPSVGDRVFAMKWNAVAPPMDYKRFVSVATVSQSVKAVAEPVATALAGQKMVANGHRDPVTMTETISTAVAGSPGAWLMKQGGLRVTEVYVHVGQVRRERNYSMFA